MGRYGKALGALIIWIWIAAAAGCAGQNSASEEPRFWAAVTLEGGSGKASVESPCPVLEREGVPLLRITWSSPYYDYMIAGGKKLLPVNTEGNSQFEIPLEGGPEDAEGAELPADRTIRVQADTTAMSTPHLIEYTLSVRFYESRREAEADAASEKESHAGQGTPAQSPGSDDGKAPELPGLRFLGKDTNEFASCFAVYRYEGGFAVLSVDDGRSYLIVPEGAEAPDPSGQGEAESLIVLRQPLDRIYLAASAVMCQMDAIGAVGNVALSGLTKEGWYIETARQAMEDGTLQYGGKYSAPDYERIVSAGTDLAVESTMILHTPKVQEKLEKLGIPVLIDRSSYESEPLGRAEWVKVYGLVTGREKEAAQAFAEQRGYVEALSEGSPEHGGDKTSRKTAAIFSINSGGQVVTRTAGDYFARMLETAGGALLTPAEESGRATQTVSMEAFYAAAEEADILIYNASIEDAPEDLSQLCGKDSILTRFRAVSGGNVWCMRSSLYQNASRTGAIIRDLAQIISGEADSGTEFFYRLK